MSTPDFFRARLVDMIDLRHPLAVLATRMPWQALEATLAPTFARKARPGTAVSLEDLFGPSMQIAGAGTSAAGRPRLPALAALSRAFLETCYCHSLHSFCHCHCHRAHGIAILFTLAIGALQFLLRGVFFYSCAQRTRMLERH